VYISFSKVGSFLSYIHRFEHTFIGQNSWNYDGYLAFFK
jgi:hypothetical protein